MSKIKKRKRIRTFSVLFLIILACLLFNLKNITVKYIYKLPYTPIVTGYCSMYGVDVCLVYSVMKAESSFDPEAKSGKGALGLMQVTEPTAKWVAERVNININSHADILNIDNNIRMGVYYLSYLFDKYDNNMTLALCAYNAGPKNVNDWLTDPKYCADGKNLDNIPFPETKKYVERVFSNYKIYKKIVE